MWILGLKGLKSLLAQWARMQASLTKSVTKTNKKWLQAGQTGIQVFFELCFIPSSVGT